MGGELIAGLLGAGLAGVAELVVWRGIDRDLTAEARAMRIVATAFIGGLAVISVVIVVLSQALGGAVDPVLGLAGAGLIGLGAFGIALAFRGYAVRSAPTPRDRAATMTRMAAAQALGVAGVILVLVPLFLSPV